MAASGCRSRRHQEQKRVGVKGLGLQLSVADLRSQISSFEYRSNAIWGHSTQEMRASRDMASSLQALPFGSAAVLLTATSSPPQTRGDLGMNFGEQQKACALAATPISYVNPTSLAMKC